MRVYVKNEKGYEESFEADWKAVKEALKKTRAEARKPRNLRAARNKKQG